MTESILLEPQKRYHLFSKATDGSNLFYSDENFNYFLSRYTKYFYPFAKTMAYCLMPNHFHFAVEIRSEDEILKAIESLNINNSFTNIDKDYELKNTLSLLIGKQFGHFLNAYTQALNKQQNRKGALFASRYKRKVISNNSYFNHLIAYIHNNPVHHGFTSQPTDWRHSSIHSYLLDKPTKIEKECFLQSFSSKKEMLLFHFNNPGFKDQFEF